MVQKLSRRRFLRRSLLLGAAPLFVASPARADHINEPHIPIKELDLRVYEYPDLANRIVVGDGSESRAWEKIRIEPVITFEKPYEGANVDPSEHFTVVVIVSRIRELTNPDGTTRPGAAIRDWDAKWKHQNRPPHGNNPYAVTASNSYLLQEHLYFWEVFASITGEESGILLEKTHRFRISEA